MFSEHYYGGDSGLLYSSKEPKRVKDLFRVQTFFLMIIGQMPSKIKELLPESYQSIGYKIACSYSAFVVVVVELPLSIFLMKTIIDNLQHGSIEEISDSITNAMIYAICCFNTCYFVWNEDTMLTLLEDINSKHKHHSMAGLTYVNGFKTYWRSEKITKIFNASCLFAVTAWGLTPIILQTYALPLQCWYPFEVTKTGLFEIMYALQLFGQWCVGISFGGTASLFFSILSVLLGQFDVLYCSLKNLTYHAELIAGKDFEAMRKMQIALPSPEDDEINQYVFLEEHRTDLIALRQMCTRFKSSRMSLKHALHLSMIECIKLHQFIVKSCRIVEEFFNFYCLIVSLQISVQLCLLIFVATEGERSYLNIFNQIQYFVLTLFDLFFFTYPGELLRQHSARCSDALWRSGWWQHIKEIRRDALIVMVNSQRVLQVTAGKFFTLDFLRFRLVLTQAFSFLTLMQTMSAKNK